LENDAVVQVNGVSKKFCRDLKRSMWYGFRDILRDTAGLRPKSDRLRRKEFWAVDDVSFELKKGETLGLIGPNGAGKTTLLKMLNGIVLPDKGNLRIKGRVGALIQIGAGFHPQLTGRENIYINGAILGMGKREIDKKFDAIVEFADIGDFLNTPVKFYSSGMFVRLGFAVAAHCEPDILLVDEVLAVGDVSFRRKCFERLGEFRDKGIPWIIVSHDMGTIMNQADRVIFLNGGKIKYIGRPDTAISNYLYCSSENNLSNKKEIADAGERSSKLPEAQITNVVLLDENEKNRDIFKTGEPFIVKIDYIARQRIDQPAFGVAIYASDGMFHTGVNTKMSGYEIEHIEGHGTMLFTIPCLPLYPGVYRVRVDLCDKYVGMLDHIQAGAYLKVKGGKTGAGLVYVDHQWELRSGTAPSQRLGL